MAELNEKDKAMIDQLAGQQLGDANATAPAPQAPVETPPQVTPPQGQAHNKGKHHNSNRRLTKNLLK